MTQTTGINNTIERSAHQEARQRETLSSLIGMATSVACLCGGVALSVQLDPSTDHSQLQLCHCHNCRAVTGLLCSSYYLMQHEPPTLEGLCRYRESPYVSRFFCETCGAHVFAQAEPSGQYLVASGVLVAEDAPPVKSVQHWKIDDTGDGGLSTFLPGWPSTETSCRLMALVEVPDNDSRKAQPGSSESSESKAQNELSAQCHCGGVEFYITPPDASSHQAQSPWSDLLVPYHSGSSDNPEDVKWWLRGGNTKYLAGACACTSCRLGSGFPIQAWAFIPKSNMFHAGRSPLRFDHGTMRQYNSSQGVYREFCSHCGATVFWHCDERPSLIDVSVGLLQSDKARAEDWLEWATGRVSFAELAVQTDLIELLVDGLGMFSRQPRV